MDTTVVTRDETQTDEKVDRKPQRERERDNSQNAVSSQHPSKTHNSVITKRSAKTKTRRERESRKERERGKRKRDRVREREINEKNDKNPACLDLCCGSSPWKIPQRQRVEKGRIEREREKEREKKEMKLTWGGRAKNEKKLESRKIGNGERTR